MSSQRERDDDRRATEAEAATWTKPQAPAPPVKSTLVQAIDRFGHKFMVYDHDLIGGTMLGGEFWDGPLLLPFYNYFSHPEKTAIDIGAFFGQGAVYLAKKNKRVIAVEPIYGAHCRRSAVDNNVANGVFVVDAAAYHGRTSMYLAPDKVQGQAVVNKDLSEIGNLGGVALVPGEPRVGDEQIIGLRLDSILHPSREAISLIKVDAQGCDLRALVGLRETIERWQPPILFEWEPDLAALHGDTWDNVERFFTVICGGVYELRNQAHRGYESCWVAVPRGETYR